MSITLHLSTTASQSARVPNAFSSSITHIAATHFPKASLSFRRPITNGLRIGAWANTNIASVKTRRPYMEAVCSVAKLEEVDAVSLDENPRTLAEKLPSSTGVYAMFDKANHLQFIGISRRLSDTVLGHLRDVPHLCGSVKVAVVDRNLYNGLDDAWDSWMDEHIEITDHIPYGNESGNSTWLLKDIPTKADLKLRPAHYEPFSAPLEELIAKLSNENEALAFIRGSRNSPRCPKSSEVMDIFHEQIIDCETVDIFDDEHNRGLRRILKAYTGCLTFPQIFLRGNFIGGVEELDLLAAGGQLYESFHKR